MVKNGWEFNDYADTSETSYIRYFGKCEISKGLDFRSVYSVSAKLDGSGLGVLNYGNCGYDGRVILYLNDKEIDHVQANITSREKTFRHNKGDTLTIKALGHTNAHGKMEHRGIIKLNFLRFYCGGKSYNM